MDETKCAFRVFVAPRFVGHPCDKPESNSAHYDKRDHARFAHDQRMDCHMFVAPRGEEKRYCGQADGCSDVAGLHWRGCSGAEPPAKEAQLPGEAKPNKAEGPVSRANTAPSAEEVVKHRWKVPAGKRPNGWEECLFSLIGRDDCRYDEHATATIRRK
jgi:hypothetical protein